MKFRGRKDGLVLFFSVLALVIAPKARAQTTIPPNGHRGAVTAMIFDTSGRILSAGEDGFIQLWDRAKNSAGERFQVSSNPISCMILRPGKPELAFVETNNAGLSRVSVWNYEQKQNLFTLPFDDRIDRVFYSASGSFLIITGGDGVERIDSTTGALLSSPAALTGTVSFAATGRSERSMVAYRGNGSLTYWDLETGANTQTVNVPRDITSPLLLGNNRFLAGFDAGGLLILDAVSGTVLIRNQNIRSGVLFTGNPEGMEFICLVPGSASPRTSTVLYHLNMRGTSRLETLNRRTVSYNIPQVNSGIVISDDAAALGTVDGRVVIFNKNGTTRLMETRINLRIEEAAASSGILAFRAENSRLGFIPLDYTDIRSGSGLRLTDSGEYTSITAGETDFILWQSENTRTFPLVRQITGAPERGAGTETFIDKLTLRFPLRSVSVYRNLCLFLDTVGNITVINRDTNDVVFTYTASGAQDAAFINEGNILIGRSAAPGSGAFLMVSIATGETVPMPIEAALGTRVFRGKSGRVYGAGISRNGNSFRTSLISFNTASPSRSGFLFEIDADDLALSLTESGGRLASTIGGKQVLLFSAQDSPQRNAAAALERSSGFPIALADGGDYFISADSDGNICWHNPVTGKILAIFRLYSDSWTLERNNRTIRGSVVRF